MDRRNNLYGDIFEQLGGKPDSRILNQPSLKKRLLLILLRICLQKIKEVYLNYLR